MDRPNWKRLRLLLVVLLFATTALSLSNPLLRVRAFVSLNSGRLEEALLTDNSIPFTLGVDSHNAWEGQHSMMEFILFSKGGGSGSVYYGCYYSYDDVPLAFQNSGAELIDMGQGTWEWKGEGDNRGTTRRLLENWYYFEASF